MTRHRIITTAGGEPLIIAEGDAGATVHVATVRPDAVPAAEALVDAANAHVARRTPNGYRQGRSNRRLARTLPRPGTRARTLFDYVRSVGSPVAGADAGRALGWDAMRAGQMLGDLERCSLVERVPGSAPLTWELSAHALTLLHGSAVARRVDTTSGPSR